MASPNTLRPNRGFTLIEIIITVAILLMMFSLGLLVSVDFYKSYSFHSEVDTIVSILQRARSLSVNNINQKAHGVHVQNNPLQYVIFECLTVDCKYVAQFSDITFDASYGVSILNTPLDVMFEQLTGNCTNPMTIKVNYEGKSYEISINSEGKINW